MSVPSRGVPRELELRNLTRFLNKAVRGRYAFLLLSTVLLGALYPVLQYGLWGTILWTVSFWIVLLACVHAISGHGAICRLARGLAAAAAIAGIIGLFCYREHDQLRGWPYAVLVGLNFLFLAYVTLVLLVDVLGSARVDKDRILGAACVYVLLGLTLAHLLLLVHSLSAEPVVARVAPANTGEAPSVLADHLYFSFVSLSTLGYGDLAPRGLTARLLASMEGVLGQLYLTVLIARLIGLHIAQIRFTDEVRHDD